MNDDEIRRGRLVALAVGTFLAFSGIVALFCHVLRQPS